MGSRPRKWKRTLLMVLLLLTGGAIINVAVAWGCAVSCRQRPVRGSIIVLSPRNTSSSWPTREADMEVLMASGWKARQPEPIDDPSFRYVVYSTSYTSFGLERTAFDEHRSIDSPYSPDPGEFGLAFRTRAGWPLMTFECWQWPDRYSRGTTSWTTRSGIELASWKIPRSTVLKVVLPICPLWPGFAINTLFYAAILWLLFAAPGFARRRIRIKRGQCPACAYPVGSSDVCTECGAVLPFPLGEGD